MNVEHIAKGTLFPFGGHLCTHWEYLAAAASDPASVSTWVRVEDSDRDCGLFRRLKTRLYSLCTCLWGKRGGEMRDHSVPVERVVTATVLKFRRLSGVGYLSGTRIRFPTGCHLEYDVDLCARLLSRRDLFARRSWRASAWPLYGPCWGLMGRGLLLCRPLRPDSYSRIMALSQTALCCWVAVSGVVRFRFPMAFWCICQGRGGRLDVRAVPFFAGRVASTPIMVGMFGPPSGWRNWSWFYAIG